MDPCMYVVFLRYPRFGPSADHRSHGPPKRTALYIMRSTNCIEGEGGFLYMGEVQQSHRISPVSPSWKLGLKASYTAYVTNGVGSGSRGR